MTSLFDTIHSSYNNDRYSSEYLARELAAAQAAWNELERPTRRDNNNDYDNNNEQGAREEDRSRKDPRDPRCWTRLQQAAWELELAQALAEWRKQFWNDNNDDDNNDNDNNNGKKEEDEKETTNNKDTNDQDKDNLHKDNANVLEDARRCESLGRLLGQFAKSEDSTLPQSSKLFQTLYQQEYLPWYDYLVSYQLLHLLRSTLKQSHYPSPEGCAALVQQAHHQGSLGTSFYAIASYMEWMHRLETVHRTVRTAVEGASALPPSTGPDAALIEWMRPLVERVQFHFVERADDRATSSRIDRLPEWLFTFLREHVFATHYDGHGPWKLVECLSSVWMAGDEITRQYASQLPRNVLNELVRLVQWVLGERNFFRHPKVAGPDSNPALLGHAIEQLLRFDNFLKRLVPEETRVLSLMDIFVAGDEELLNWWMQRERESAFATLFEENVTTALVNRVSPRAELFGALIRSVQAKARVFSFSGPYLHQVATPLCMQFLDAVHDSSTELRNVLVQRHIPTLEELQRNITEWIEITNGTHMAALILAPDSTSDTHGADEEEPVSSLGGHQDLARFGRSLQSLERVLVEEFAKTFVETLLLERARFAAYLMRSSSLLASHDAEAMESSHGSSELRETKRLVHLFLRICDDTSALDDMASHEEGAEARELAMYGPRLMRDSVLTLLAEKLLDVALDFQSMTPDLLQPGAVVFRDHVASLFGSSVTLPSSALRLLDVTAVMAMDATQLAQIGDALCGLADHPPPLAAEHFISDERLYEEAMDMIRAKGLAWIELDDVLSILNRRRDLVSSVAF